MLVNCGEEYVDDSVTHEIMVVAGQSGEK